MCIVNSLFLIVQFKVSKLCLLVPWEAILSNAPPCEYFIKYMGNPRKYRNEYNQPTAAAKMFIILSELNVQVYVFLEYFLGFKNTLQACQTSVPSISSIHGACDTVPQVCWKVTVT